jgi:alpha/beta superfamily hydrolase
MSFQDKNLPAAEKFEFPSTDGLTITADLYEIGHDNPVIVLCHQARFSRGEYTKIARKLNKKGFNCLAIDQRSGDQVNKVINETAKLAKEKGLPQEYIHAEPDIIAAVNWAAARYEKSVTLWGSSYSASLALKVGTEHDKVEIIISFSPGEYFGEDLTLKNVIAPLDKPVFVTSSKKEASQVRDVLSLNESDKVTHFIPREDGIHGSRALWKSTPNHEEYWTALERFLKRYH